MSSTPKLLNLVPTWANITRHNTLSCCHVDALSPDVIVYKLVANSADFLSRALITQYNVLHPLSQIQGD